MNTTCIVTTEHLHRDIVLLCLALTGIVIHITMLYCFKRSVEVYNSGKLDVLLLIITQLLLHITIVIGQSILLSHTAHRDTRICYARWYISMFREFFLIIRNTWIVVVCAFRLWAATFGLAKNPPPVVSRPPDREVTKFYLSWYGGLVLLSAGGVALRYAVSEVGQNTPAEMVVFILKIGIPVPATCFLTALCVSRVTRRNTQHNHIQLGKDSDRFRAWKQTRVFLASIAVAFCALQVPPFVFKAVHILYVSPGEYHFVDAHQPTVFAMNTLVALDLTFNVLLWMLALNEFRKIMRSASSRRRNNTTTEVAL